MRKVLLLLALSAITSAAADAPRGVERIVHSTFKLFNDSSTATCFLIHTDDAPEKPIIVTAAHVFEKMKGDHALLVLRKPDDRGGYKRHDFKVMVRDGKKPLWTKHPKHDIAALQIPEKPEDVPCPTLPVSVLAGEKKLKELATTIGDRVFVLSYPERFEANDAGFPVARNATIASFPLLPVARFDSFLTDFTAFGGDSGGPVFLAADGDEETPIIGISVSQYRHDEKLKMLNEERTVHHPLGIGKAMHAQFILDTIDRLKKP